MSFYDFGSLYVALVVFTIFFSIHLIKRRKAALAANKAFEQAMLDDDGVEVSDLSFSAKRDLDTPFVGSAVAPQKAKQVKRVDAPRGATRVKPVEIDYSIFDQPTFIRRGLQLSY